MQISELVDAQKNNTFRVLRTPLIYRTPLVIAPAMSGLAWQRHIQKVTRLIFARTCIRAVINSVYFNGFAFRWKEENRWTTSSNREGKFLLQLHINHEHQANCENFLHEKSIAIFSYVAKIITISVRWIDSMKLFYVRIFVRIRAIHFSKHS